MTWIAEAANRKKKRYVKDDEGYTTAEVMSISGCGASSAKVRLRKWIDGVITTEQLLQKPRDSNYKKKLKLHHIDGYGEYTTHELVLMLGIEVNCLYERLSKYRRGLIDAHKLMHVGTYPVSCYTDNRELGNAEWRSLGNKPRPVTGPPPGSWEKRHIKQPDIGQAPSSVARAVGDSYCAQKDKDRLVPYSGQYCFGAR